MPTWNRSGTVSRESLIVGEWTELYAIVNGTTLRIGSVKTGKLNIRKKFLVHRGMQKFGTVPDRADCVSTRMTFEGRIEEIHRENLLFLLNRPPDEAKVPAAGDDPFGRVGINDQHYPAQFFTLYGKRPYATGEADDLVFVMWRCRSADYVRLAMMRDGMRFKAIALSDKDGDYGGSAESPYGWVYGYDASAAPPVPPIPPPIDLEACWWTFDNTPPIDYIEAQNDYGDDFDPMGSFTVMTLVEEINEDTNLRHGVIGKMAVGLIQPGGWEVSYLGQDSISWPGGVYFSTGKDGVWYKELRLDSPGPMAVDRKVLIACMYTWVGDGTSIMRIVTHDAVNGKLSTQLNNAYGPIANNILKLRIGNTHRFNRPVGVKYWCGFYDGVVIPDVDILDVWNGNKHPIDDFNPTMLNYFCQDVAVTYDGDECNGPNAPYVFDVISTPVKGP